MKIPIAKQRTRTGTAQARSPYCECSASQQADHNEQQDRSKLRCKGGSRRLAQTTEPPGPLSGQRSQRGLPPHDAAPRLTPKAPSARRADVIVVRERRLWVET